MEKIVAKELLKIEAVFLKPSDPFTWASGIKSPIYCDNRLTLSFPSTRTIIKEALAKKVKELYPNAQYIAGEGGAVPHAALVSEALNLPLCYVRGSQKAHGRQNLVEGKIVQGADVVVVEDLISTGGSSLKVVNVLKEAGFNVLGVVAIFSYNMEKATTRFNEASMPFTSVSNYDALLEVAVEEEYIKEADLKKLKAFIKNPSDASWMNK